jgi:hypothetical protein
MSKPVCRLPYNDNDNVAAEIADVLQHKSSSCEAFCEHQ